MRILVSNDDGIEADGLALLERIARRLADEVWVVAPDGERSWSGRSHTTYLPIRAHPKGERRWAVTGTPADCAMFGIRTLMAGSPPDLVLSGINHGSNLGEEAGYSGTLAAAMEGTVAGIRSIALSQLYHPETRALDWSVAERHAERVIRALVDLDWPAGVLMSINFPALTSTEHPAGVRFTDLARANVSTGLYYDERRLDHLGRTYYWTGFRPNPHSEDGDSDVGAVAAGRISITPLHLDLTHRATLDALRARQATDLADT